MKKAQHILYTIGKTLYINLTNRCPCRCEFCVRTHGDGVGDADSLWLDHEPSLEEAVAAFDKYDLSRFDEAVFCGYGEPMERLEVLLGVCRFLREHTELPIRINTNGLADLIHQKPTAHLLKGLADTVSISLNAPTAQEYVELCHPTFGEASFEAILKFAGDCRHAVPEVILSVVDVIPPERVDLCREIAEELDVDFRLREYWT